MKQKKEIDQMADKSGGVDFLAGFLVGALAGAAAALLLAPQSGEETRTMIRDRSIELGHRAEELGEEARKRAEELSEEARKRAEDAQAKVKQAVEEGKVTATKKKEELLSQVSKEPPAEEIVVEEIAVEG
jgi:gas vesicle protein